jgi:hypothetical protein
MREGLSISPADFALQLEIPLRPILIGIENDGMYLNDDRYLGPIATALSTSCTELRFTALKECAWDVVHKIIHPRPGFILPSRVAEAIRKDVHMWLQEQRAGMVEDSSFRRLPTIEGLKKFILARYQGVQPGPIAGTPEDSCPRCGAVIDEHPASQCKECGLHLDSNY